jgi:hypothetical protein
MSFRAKCPACGRKQSLEESDVGRTVWCSACGTRFVVEWSAPEADAGQSTIPDIDFPTTFASQAFASAPPVVPVLPVPPPPPPPPPVPAPQVQVALTPPPQPEPAFVQPQPIVTAPSRDILIPILVGLVVTLGTALAAGLFTIVYLVNRPPQQVKVVQPAAVPVALIPQSPPHIGSSVVANNAALRPQITSATMPVSLPSPVSSDQENPTRTTTAPVAAKTDETSPPGFRPVPASTTPDLDDQIGRSIDNGVTFLLNQFAGGQLRDIDKRSGLGPGMDALAVYALLQAGEATHDLRLNSNSPLVAKMLDVLKTLNIPNDDATYSRSLRAAALGVYHRADDTKALRADAAWLTTNSSYGAYTYGTPETGNAPVGIRQRFRFSGPWDNSNSQYGALGVWAAIEAGVTVSNSYWLAVQKHWLNCQLPDGEWAYGGYGDMGRMSMTVAGITTLLVAQDQLGSASLGNALGQAPYSKVLQNGLNWLEAGNNSVHLPDYWRTYALFGLERAALASGFKYFGNHNWYRELAIEQIGLQQPDGSWAGTDPIVDTSYTLLFLSRGRHPIFMNKLRFDGYWSNRPRDISNLTHYAATELERPLNWQVVSLKSSWTDWMDSPVLFIAGHEALKFTDEDCDKLRSFANNGGLIFTHADGDTAAFNRSVADLAKKLFPQYPLSDLPPDHPVFSTLYKIKLQPKLQGISNGSRLLLLHSPTDLNRVWQQRDWSGHPVNFQMGVNIFIYAAGKANLNNKLKTPLVADVDVKPILATSIAQLRYRGDFNPEPAGLPRFASLFLRDTSVKVTVTDADPAELDPQKIPLVHLTGTGPVAFDAVQLQAIHDYVDGGGILLIDACGASPAFLRSMLLDFLPHAFPKSRATDMPRDNPILAGTGAGMTPVSLRVRPYRVELDGTSQQPIQFFTLGKGMVIFSPIDLSTGLLGTNTWGINGYEPAAAYDLVRNVLLNSLETTPPH